MCNSRRQLILCYLIFGLMCSLFLMFSCYISMYFHVFFFFLILINTKKMALCRLFLYFCSANLKKIYIMKKIYLIQKTTVFDEKESHEWSPLFAYRDYDVATFELESFRESEEVNRLMRLDSFKDILFKVYYKIDEISLY